jgi:tetratricopeptide (TPR) repeat protein
MAYFQVGEYQEALDTLEHGILLPGSPREEIYVAKGQALFSMHQFEEALQAYEQGLVWSPAALPLWQAKVVVLKALGRDEEMIIAQKNVEQLESAHYQSLQVHVY